MVKRYEVWQIIDEKKRTLMRDTWWDKTRQGRTSWSTATWIKKARWAKRTDDIRLYNAKKIDEVAFILWKWICWFRIMHRLFWLIYSDLQFWPLTYIVFQTWWTCAETLTWEMASTWTPRPAGTTWSVTTCTHTGLPARQVQASHPGTRYVTRTSSARLDQARAEKMWCRCFLSGFIKTCY